MGQEFDDWKRQHNGQATDIEWLHEGLVRLENKVDKLIFLILGAILTSGTALMVVLFETLGRGR